MKVRTNESQVQVVQCDCGAVEHVGNWMLEKGCNWSLPSILTFCSNKWMQWKASFLRTQKLKEKRWVAFHVVITFEWWLHWCFIKHLLVVTSSDRSYASDLRNDAICQHHTINSCPHQRSLLPNVHHRAFRLLLPYLTSLSVVLSFPEATHIRVYAAGPFFWLCARPQAASAVACSLNYPGQKPLAFKLTSFSIHGFLWRLVRTES